MNGQYLMNKAITVSYAFKKDGKGERHGTAAGKVFIINIYTYNIFITIKKIKNLIFQKFILYKYIYLYKLNNH